MPPPQLHARDPVFVSGGVFRGVYFQKSMTWNDEIAGMQGLCAHAHILDVYALEFGSLIFIYLSCLLYLLDCCLRC